MMNLYYTTDNTAKAVLTKDIPEVCYADLYEDLCQRMKQVRYHVAHYFALPQENRLRFYCILLDDEQHQILLTSHSMDYYDEGELKSLSAIHPQFHPFERDITERFGIRFERMPWAKPLRFAFDRFDRKSTIDNYPFYKIDGERLHEVNVGPIHAGVIEPGAFRFICSGEEVLHLEIALGYQHRGVEHAFATTQNRLRQVCLSESIAGDSSVSHAMAFCSALEKLSDNAADPRLDLERGIALELERMAMQIADTGALSMDVGYQLGQVACEALRTMTINTTQAWCGNRFGKTLIRPHGSFHPLTEEKATMIAQNVAEIARRYAEVADDVKSSPSVLARFEQCGIVPRHEMIRIGGVGQAARASSVGRDIRASHPWGVYVETIQHTPQLKHHGDVMARLKIRCREVLQSAQYIQTMLQTYTKQYATAQTTVCKPDYTAELRPNALSLSLIEGWRGEICHVILTDNEGKIEAVRIKDPSLHNWLALALAVRGEGISDFPICNKSFNLSYCGHDL